MSCLTFSKKNQKKNFEKRKLETVLFCHSVFVILLAISQARTRSTFVYNHLKTTAAITLPTYLLWTMTSLTETRALTPEAITSFDVMYLLTLWTLTTLKSRDSSRKLTSYSEPIQCYSHPDSLLSEQNLVYIADKFHQFVRAHQLLRINVKSPIISSQPLSDEEGSNQCSASEQYQLVSNVFVYLFTFSFSYGDDIFII